MSIGDRVASVEATSEETFFYGMTRRFFLSDLTEWTHKSAPKWRLLAE